MDKTLYGEFIALAERETGRRADEITSLWWNNRNGKLNGMVEIDGERVRIGEAANVGNAEIMKAVISTGLHIHYRDENASNVDEVLALAIEIKDALNSLYRLTDQEWAAVLSDIGSYADCLI